MEVFEKGSMVDSCRAWNLQHLQVVLSQFGLFERAISIVVIISPMMIG